MTTEPNNTPFLALTKEEHDIVHRALHRAVDVATQHTVEALGAQDHYMAQVSQAAMGSYGAVLNKLHEHAAGGTSDAEFFADPQAVDFMLNATVAFLGHARMALEENAVPAEYVDDVKERIGYAQTTAAKLAAFLREQAPDYAAGMVRAATEAMHGGEGSLPKWNEADPREQASFREYVELLNGGPVPQSTRLQ